MKSKPLVILFTLIALSSEAQQVFQRTYATQNRDQINSIITVGNDSLMMLGTSYSELNPADLSVLLIKSDLNGDIAWSEMYSTSGTDFRSTSIAKGGNGYGIVGRSFSPNGSNSSEFFFMHVDDHGNLTSAIQIEGSENEGFHEIVSDTDSTFIAFGSSNSFFTGSTIGMVGARIHQNGDTLWTRVFGGDEQDIAYSVHKTSDSAFIISGSTTSFDSQYDFSAFLMKINGDGNVLWHKSYHEEDFDFFPTHVFQTSDNGFLLTGNHEGQNSAEDDIFALKTNATGDLEWIKVIGNEGSESAHSAIETPNGDFLIVGDNIKHFSDTVGLGKLDALMIKIDNNGSLLSAQVYGTKELDEVYTITSTGNGDYYIGGVTYGWNDTTFAEYDAYLIKTDENGLSGCNEMPITFTTWEPSITVSNNSVTVIPTAATVSNLTPVVGGTISDLIYCSGQAGLVELADTPKELIKIVDLMGRETKYRPNTPLIYIYSDGTTEKVYRLE